jgi:hypothetical protein
MDGDPVSVLYDCRRKYLHSPQASRQRRDARSDFLHLGDGVRARHGAVLRLSVAAGAVRLHFRTVLRAAL